MTRKKTGGLTETERKRLEYICAGVAAGRKANDAAAEIGLDQGKLAALLSRAHFLGFNTCDRVAVLYADRFAEAIKAGEDPPPIPGDHFQTAIGIECAYRGYDLNLLNIQREPGVDREWAAAEIQRQSDNLQEPELERLIELLFFKIKLRDWRIRAQEQRRNKCLTGEERQGL